MGGLHLGRLVVRDVALPRLPALAGLVIIMVEPLPNLGNPLAEGLHKLPLALDDLSFRLALILLPMLLQYPSNRLLHLGRLLLELSPGPAPLLRCVGRELPPVDGKHLLADQPQVVAHQ